MEFGLESEELGFRTKGFGRTPWQVLFTAAPQRDGLPYNDEGDIVLKKLPVGNSP